MKPHFRLIQLFFITAFLAGIKTFAQENPDKPCIENMSNAQRDQILNPAEGTMIFNTSTGCLNYYQDKKWRIFCESNDGKGEAVQFDQNTGKLKYQINGQWYSFAMEKRTPTSDVPIQSNTEHKDEHVVNEEQNISTSNLPADCKRKPTRPYAGRDLLGFDIIDLEANTPSHGTGFWQVMRGEGGSFVDSTVPTSQFTGEQGITYVLRWTIATECDTLFDETMVRIRPPCDPWPSQSFAGTDQFNVEEARLNANLPRIGKGSWTILSGLGGHIEEPTNPRSKIIGRAGQTYVVRWIIRNECGLTMDDVIISFKPPCTPKPSVAYAGEDQIEVEDCKLRAEKPKYGKGRWKIISGKNGRVHNRDTNITYLYGDPGETYVLNWTVTTKCGETKDQIRVKFSSFCPKEFTDERDGQKYRAMRIAGQCWMAENLQFRPNDSHEFCFEGYLDNCQKYGALYPWNIAMDGDKKPGDKGICPKGWHVPTDEEWGKIIDSSGFKSHELKVSGVSGFDIPMGGARYTNGRYFNRSEYAYFWSSTSRDDEAAWNRYFPAKNDPPDRFPADKDHSFSLRCVKDED